MTRLDSRETLTNYREWGEDPHSPSLNENDDSLLTCEIDDADEYEDDCSGDEPWSKRFIVMLVVFGACAWLVHHIKRPFIRQ